MRHVVYPVEVRLTFLIGDPFLLGGEVFIALPLCAHRVSSVVLGCGSRAGTPAVSEYTLSRLKGQSIFH